MIFDEFYVICYMELLFTSWEIWFPFRPPLRISNGIAFRKYNWRGLIIDYGQI